MRNQTKTLDIVYTAIGAALIAICSWVSIPLTVPFTLQTFAVFFILSLLGGKRGTAAIAVYLLLGAIGLPVFAEMTAGLGILLGTTGGYLIGFLLTGLIFWAAERLFGSRLWVQIPALVLGLAACYALGTVWFQFVYSRENGAVGLTAVLGWCVFPFVLPDLMKMGLALTVAQRIAPLLRVKARAKSE